MHTELGARGVSRQATGHGLFAQEFTETFAAPQIRRKQGFLYTPRMLTERGARAVSRQVYSLGVNMTIDQQAQCSLDAVLHMRLVNVGPDTYLRVEVVKRMH